MVTHTIFSPYGMHSVHNCIYWATPTPPASSPTYSLSGCSAGELCNNNKMFSVYNQSGPAKYSCGFPCNVKQRQGWLILDIMPIYLDLNVLSTTHGHLNLAQDEHVAWPTVQVI